MQRIKQKGSKVGGKNSD